MLEKMAEMVREDALEYDDMNDLTLRCLECDFKPILGKNCRNMQGKDCPLLFNREEKEDFVDGSLMLARWAVLLVARDSFIAEQLERYAKAHAEMWAAAVGTDARRNAEAVMESAWNRIGIRFWLMAKEAKEAHDA